MRLVKDPALEYSIAKQRNNLKSDRLDMTFGEIIHLYEDDNLIISPEFQRLFRWDISQRTKFIESIIIGIPIPPIFVAEDDDGRWELVDGLQRISTILSFFSNLKDDTQNNAFKLCKGSLLPELEGYDHDSVPIKVSNTIKRSVCRVEILRWDSQKDMRYEVFSRLNKTGSLLTPQELRNAIFRGEDEQVFRIIKELSLNERFINLVKISQKKKEELFDQEIVLRYLYYQYSPLNNQKQPFHEQLDSFLLAVTKKEIDINFQDAKDMFWKDMDFITEKLDNDILKDSIGKFYPAVFDALSYSLRNYRKEIYENPNPCMKVFREMKNNKDGEFKKLQVSSYSSKRKKDTTKLLDRKMNEAYPGN